MGESPVASAKRDRVRAHLLDLVEASAPGASIPSERRLSEALGVSRPTLRSVVDEFVRDGVLVREHGRGVFLARPKVARGLGQVGPGDARRPTSTDGEWTSRTLAFEVVAAGARVGRRLRLGPPERVVRVRRVRLVRGEPVCVETIHLPRAVVPGLAAVDLVGMPLYALLRHRFDVRPARAVQVIEPTVADEGEAALLDVPAGSPALLFQRTTVDGVGRAIEFTRSVYRGDRYRLVSSLELDAGRRSVLAGRWSPDGDSMSELLPDPDWPGILDPI